MNLKTNPELLPLIEWWEKDGKKVVLCVAIAFAAFGAWKYVQYHRESVRGVGAAGVMAFDPAKGPVEPTIEEREECLPQISGSAPEAAVRVCLARQYFDRNDKEGFEKALEQYNELARNAPDGFADIALVGKAQCMEALGDYAAAGDAFAAYADDPANAESYLKLTAEVGVVRCLAEKGDKAAAEAKIAALKEIYKDGIGAYRVSEVERFVKWYGKSARPAPIVAAVETPVETPAPAETPAAK